MAADATRSESESSSWRVSNVTGRDGSLSPVKKIISVNENGLVFRSSKPFELCSELALGLHIARIRRPGTRFMNVSGFVVSNEPSGEAGSPSSGRGADYHSGSYDVTIVFERVGEEDRALLRRICSPKEAEATTTPPKPRNSANSGSTNPGFFAP